MTSTPELIDFSRFSVDERTEMRAFVDRQLDVERSWVDPTRVIDDASSLCDRLSEFDLLRPSLEIDHFGIVSPIRDRVPSRDDPIEIQSYPFITPDTHDFISELMTKLYEAVMEKRALYDVDNIAFSITSLLRTVKYQALIARNGQLASDPSLGQTSSHSMGWAFDTDHGGGYVYVDGQWRNANPSINFELWRPIRKVMREVFATVMASMGDHNSIDEVPDGWGTYHVAVRPVLEI